GRASLIVAPVVAAAVHGLAVGRRELLARSRVAVGHPLAVHGVVAPGRCLDLPRVDHGRLVDVDRPVHVYVDVAVPPVPVTPPVIPRDGHGDGGAEHDDARGDRRTGRVVSVR